MDEKCSNDKVKIVKLFLKFFDTNPDEWNSLMKTLRVWGVTLIITIVVVCLAIYFDEDLKKIISSQLVLTQ